MKAQQTRRALLVISTILLLITYSCRTQKSKYLIDGDTYNIVNRLLSHQFEVKSFAEREPLILTDTILKFYKSDFNKSINSFQNFKKEVLRIPACADTVYNQFNFGKVLKNDSKGKTWGLEGIVSKKVVVKPISKLKGGDRYVSFSLPIFNKRKKLALIKANVGNEGEIIYFFKKSQNLWKIDCELYISHY